MTQEERAALRTLYEIAKPELWVISCGEWIYPNDKQLKRFSDVITKRQCDADFILASRNAVPALLDALEKAEEENAMLREDVQRWCETCIHRKEKLNPFKDVNYCQECQNSREPVYRNWKWWGDERIEESK